MTCNVSAPFLSTVPPRFFSTWTSLFPCFHGRNVDTGYCPRATLGTKRWINTPLNKQLLSALFELSFFPSFLLYFPLFSPTLFSVHSFARFSGQKRGKDLSPRCRTSRGEGARLAIGRSAANFAERAEHARARQAAACRRRGSKFQTRPR